MAKKLIKIFIKLLVVALVAGIVFFAKYLNHGWLIFNGPSEAVCREYIKENGTDNIYYKLFAADSPYTGPEAAQLIPPSTALSDIFVSVEEEAAPEHTLILETLPDGSVRDQYGLIDNDGDGVVVMDVGAEGYMGKMIVCWDPTRVRLGMQNDFNSGLTVGQICEKYDALGGINAGGFEDPGGNTNGGKPASIVVCDGVYYNCAEGAYYEVVGLTDDGEMIMGYYTPQELRELKVHSACNFGPMLMKDGELLENSGYASGLYPRSAIAQRDDGAIMLLAIDGYQAHSAGCSGMDIAALFKEYHGVIAYNLDGGASTCMVWNGETINLPSSMYSDRTIPNAFIVMKEGK